MGASFGIDHGMQFVQYHGFGSRQHVLSGFGSQHQVEGFRRGNQDVGRFPYHFLPLSLGGIACANAYGKQVLCSDSRKRAFEILPDIRGQGFQRGNINQLEFLFQRVLFCLRFHAV